MCDMIEDFLIYV